MSMSSAYFAEKGKSAVACWVDKQIGCLWSLRDGRLGKQDRRSDPRSAPREGLTGDIRLRTW